MNNYEKIKNMSIDEMAEFIDKLTNTGEHTCPYCQHYFNDGYGRCVYGYCKCSDIARLNGIKLWLESGK